MRYVSTRGEAAPLDFVEVMLAGLARDGGLYVPESWPALGTATIAGFAGRPYAEVAVEVIRPFVGDGIAEADLARMAREAYGTFRHPATAPLAQLGPSLFVLELFHGPTLAFKDLAMQLVARLMDHVLHQRGERTTIVVATSGDTGGAAVEAFRGRAQVDVVVLFPHGRISDVQRRMMTTVPDANVHALGDRRHLRRLPGAGEGDVQSSCLPRPRAAVRRQFHQLGAHRGAGGLLLHRRGGARRAAPESRLHRADRKFRRRLCRLCRHPHGAAGRPAGGGDQCQRHPRPHLRDRRLRAARRGGDHLAVDGYPGLVEFRAAVVRRLWPRRQAGAPR